MKPSLCLRFILLCLVTLASACGPNPVAPTPVATDRPSATASHKPEASETELVPRVTEPPSVTDTPTPALDEIELTRLQSARLLFVSTRDGIEEIYSMNGDGSDQVRLTHNGRQNFSPAWSPDGKQITFISQTQKAYGTPESSHLYRMDADGTNPVDLTVGRAEQVLSYAWSPDGRYLAFVAWPPTADEGWGTNIFLVTPDGRELKQWTHLDEYDVGCYSPTWSPDGRQLAYACRYLMQVDTTIANVDGSGEPTSLDLGQVYQLFWSSQGQDILIIDGECSIQVITLGNNDWRPCWGGSIDNLSTEVVEKSDCPESTDIMYGPARNVSSDMVWAPLKGDRLAQGAIKGVKLVDKEGSMIVRVKNERVNCVRSLDWSHDENYIAFSAGQGKKDEEIYGWIVAGEGIAQLTQNEAEDFDPAWRP